MAPIIHTLFYDVALMWYACQAEAAPRTVLVHSSMAHKLYHQHYLKARHTP